MICDDKSAALQAKEAACDAAEADQQVPRTIALSISEWSEQARDGGRIPVRFRVTGNSMRPLIRIMRDTVTVIPLDRPLKIGDVVLFKGEHKYVLHRLWKMDAGRVNTLGDGCYAPDGWMGLDRVLGRMILLERDGRIFQADSPWLLAYGRVWMALRPLRRILFLPERAIAWARHRIARLKKRNG